MIKYAICEVKMKLENTQKISASMVASNAKLSTIGAFQIIQDAVTEFMGALKVDGITVRQKYNAFWVFVKTRAKFFKSLGWGDEYSVTAFFSSMSLAKLYTDVEVRDKSKDLVFYARVELCVLDIPTQRIKKIASVGIDESMLTPATEEIVFGRPDETALAPVEQVKVRSTNIDHSHHTNNLEYLRFIMNTYSVAELEKKRIKEMEVVYASQSYENDALDVLKAEYKDRDLIVLQKDGKPVIKCEIVTA